MTLESLPMHLWADHELENFIVQNEIILSNMDDNHARHILIEPIRLAYEELRKRNNQ